MSHQSTYVAMDKRQQKYAVASVMDKIVGDPKRKRTEFRFLPQYFVHEEIYQGATGNSCRANSMFSGSV